MLAFRTTCPSAADLPERLASVLQVTYLVFNEGYAASSGDLADPPRSLATKRFG